MALSISACCIIDDVETACRARIADWFDEIVAMDVAEIPAPRSLQREARPNVRSRPDSGLLATPPDLVSRQTSSVQKKR